MINKTNQINNKKNKTKKIIYNKKNNKVNKLKNGLIIYLLNLV